MALQRKGEGLWPGDPGSDSTFPRQDDVLIGSIKVCVLGGHSCGCFYTELGRVSLSGRAFGIGWSTAVLLSRKVFGTSLLFSPPQGALLGK